MTTIAAAPVKNLVHLLRSRAETHPDVAFTYLPDGQSENVLRCRDIDRQARAVAAELQTVGTPDERALLVYPSGFAIVPAYFGALYAGMVPVLVPPPRADVSPTEQIAVAIDAAPTVVLTTQALAPLLAPLCAHPALAHLRVVATDAIVDDAARAAAWRPYDPPVEALAHLMYTSGSTGDPKGVMQRQADLATAFKANRAIYQPMFDRGPSVTFMPTYHVQGFLGALLTPLLYGRPSVTIATAAFMEQPACWLQAITRYRGTSSMAPNFALQACIDRVPPAAREALDLRSWEAAIIGAETVRLETLDQFVRAYAPHVFSRRALRVAYGMS